VNAPKQKTCSLRLAAQGEIEVCPEDRCVFWESGGAVLKGNCIVERLGIDVRDPELAAYLLEVRERVEQAKDSDEAEAAHREFAHRLGRDV
jgi:hypothetical protein